MERFCFVPTKLGLFTLVADAGRLVGTRLPHRDRGACLEHVRLSFPDAEHDARLLPELREAIRAYFRGEKRVFGVTLDQGGMTPFQRAVVRVCRKIPYGQTCSYGELAARSGYPNAARAAGSVMRKNRFPLIVPCHRVVASGGKLGGFSGTGGVALKRALLDIESAGIKQPTRKRACARQPE